MGQGQSRRGILWAGQAAWDPPGIADDGDLVTPKSSQVVRKSWRFRDLYDKASQVDRENLLAVLEPLEVVEEGI